ncbi:unnamed protein product [Nezara viridula]|uniref:Protein kinase domain-containing protein n=1 Tax=Nezara viridula TaxID=85310 RepID=A0A9P0HCH8_NEZVI|nr:unnamed protein product [Nezara viridula]
MEIPCTPKSSYKGENNSGNFSPLLLPQTPAMTKLGFGTSVSVYHLHRSPRFGNERSPWAIKKRNTRAQRKIISERLYKEAKILSSLNHPNIVGFRGFITIPDGREVLLMEECTQSLGQLNSIKLCDFGVSLNIGEDGTSDEEYIGTLPWTAPEALEDGPITEKVDIFAFGLTIYEMLTLKSPHVDSFDESLMDLTGKSELLDDSVEEPYGTRPELPSLGAEYNDIVALFNWCTEEDYKKRPRARDMLSALIT